ncbi:hypothetical protein [Actimicrobium sp. CCI2.3]|uniref:hypothetical protein n=1 Tax=Actimicrobium sp. CCI2.3 TaxID=3048616 RepID=UPI002AB433FA|nr:hypothetical protein [Actimicrobium sp. CCI2.3]MDY7574188.1 hypothetical protein [Actimicrobium sp. CCI2.3]MEB0023845.1 hypothetical protein [Actimicrobium sp. CCI2.3]
MFYTLTWLLMALLLALWSAAAWVLHTVAQWSGAQAGGMAGLPAQLGMLPAPAWLSSWLPLGAQESWSAVLTSLTPLLESMLAFAPALLTLLVPAIWLMWAIGAVLLVALGLGLTVLFRVARSRMGAMATANRSLARQ